MNTRQYITHCIHRAYIALARCERIVLPGPRYTDAECLSDIEAAMPSDAQAGRRFSFAQREWFDDERLLERVRAARGLLPDEVFAKGIIASPSRMQNRFICQRLSAAFGVEAVAMQPHFDTSGLLQYQRRTDFFFPVRRNGLIERFAFYTFREMEQWGQAKAA